MRGAGFGMQPLTTAELGELRPTDRQLLLLLLQTVGCAGMRRTIMQWGSRSQSVQPSRTFHVRLYRDGRLM